MSEWNTLATLPLLETDHCSIDVDFYDKDGAVYQGYYIEEDSFFYWYSYDYKRFIENVKGWAYLPDAPSNNAGNES